MTDRAVLLDTHVLLWWRAGGDRLSQPAARTVDRATTRLISPISFWEAATLLALGRIQLDREVRRWAQDVLAEDGVEAAELSPGIAVDAALLRGEGFGGDPADQIIYATARQRRVPLVTKDAMLRRFAAATGEVATVW